MPEEGPRERLLRAARAEFIERGFADASTNQILAAAGAHKASLYRYFPDKTSLCLAVLEAIGQEFAGGLEAIAGRAADWPDFVTRWSRLLRKQIRVGHFQGCPLSRVVSALPQDQTALRQAGRSVFELWAATLSRIFIGLHGSTQDESLAAEYGRTILILYEGAAQMFTLTGAVSAFDLMEKQLKAMDDRPAALRG